MLAAARDFFAVREIMEVDTPALAATAPTDPQISSVPVQLLSYPDQTLYLQTSPEYLMKRLLAAGCPDIYQLGKVYRDGERGRHHQPEFTLAEWYRHGVDLQTLARESADFIHEVAASGERTPGPASRLSYRDAFLAHAGIDPLTADEATLRDCAAGHVDQGGDLELDRDAWLDLLLSDVVSRAFPADSLTILTDYPASQAALARLHPEDPRVAERFEIFWGPVELANGYRELSDPAEQAARFARDTARRRQRGLMPVAEDQALLAALTAGLPDCCGVAVGFDRILMLSLGLDGVDATLSFSL